MTIFLSSYRPLTQFTEGRQAIITYNLPPFLDYSCRREPDFMSVYPSISALCHVNKFAPRLHKGDIVTFITCKGRYLTIQQAHWRLVAVLEVLERFESHDEAADWYKNQGVDLPRNCMVKGNEPLSMDMTAPITEFGTNITLWNAAYKNRAKQCGVFLACKPHYRELHSPPIITDQMMQEAFKRIPGTQNPPKISSEEFNKLKELCGVE